MNSLGIFCFFLCLQMTRGCIRSGTSISGGELTESGSGGSGQGGGDNDPVTGDATGGNDNTENGDDDDTSALSGCPSIITRSQWGARAPKSITRMKSAPLYVVIHHGAGSRCYTVDKCKEKVQEYQNLHMDSRSKLRQSRYVLLYSFIIM